MKSLGFRCMWNNKTLPWPFEVDTSTYLPDVACIHRGLPRWIHWTEGKYVQVSTEKGLGDIFIPYALILEILENLQTRSMPSSSFWLLFWIFNFWRENFQAADWLKNTWLINIHRWPNCGKRSLVENHVQITCFRWRVIVDPIALNAHWLKTTCFLFEM